MTNQEAIEVMFNEWKCIDRNDGIHCDRKCESCDLVMDVEIIREAYNMAISALEKQIPKKAMKSIDAYNNNLYRLHCPTCGALVANGNSRVGFMNKVSNGYERCAACGQMIDWEE